MSGLYVQRINVLERKKKRDFFFLKGPSSLYPYKIRQQKIYNYTFD